MTPVYDWNRWKFWSILYWQGKVGDPQNIIHNTIYRVRMLNTLIISVYLRLSLNIDVSVPPLNKTFSW